MFHHGEAGCAPTTLYRSAAAGGPIHRGKDVAFGAKTVHPNRRRPGRHATDADGIRAIGVPGHDRIGGRLWRASAGTVPRQPPATGVDERDSPRRQRHRAHSADQGNAARNRSHHRFAARRRGLRRTGARGGRFRLHHQGQDLPEPVTHRRPSAWSWAFWRWTWGPAMIDARDLTWRGPRFEGLFAY